MSPRPDSFQIVSTFGVALDTVPSPTGGFSYSPFRLLTHSAWAASGSGSQRLDPGSVSGQRGAIEIEGRSGTLAAIQSIFDLALTDPPGTGVISIRMTAGQQLTVIQQNQHGTVVAQVVLSKVYTVDAPFHLRYVWDQQSVIGSRYAAVFLDDDQDFLATWLVSPTAPWQWFQPVYAAISVPRAGTVIFGGTVTKVQLSNDVQLVPNYTPLVDEEVGAHLYANSAMASAARMQYAVAGDSTADSSVAAETGVVWSVASAISADSSVVANNDP